MQKKHTGDEKNHDVNVQWRRDIGLFEEIASCPK